MTVMNAAPPAAAYDARSNYSALNGLRFLAALGVVAFHYMPATGSASLSSLVQCGPAAVGFFFLLSGFVLAHRHPSTPSKTAFWWARFVRIYPMYLLAFLLFLPMAVEKYRGAPIHLPALAALLNLFMLQSWTPLSQSWNGPSWSLSVEAFLYAMFPFLVVPIGRANRRVVWCLVAMLPAALTVLFCLNVIPAQAWRSWIGNNPAFWVPVFCLGISLGLWRSGHADSERPVDIPAALVLAAVVFSALFWPAEFREVFINGGAILLFAGAIVLCSFRTVLVGRLLGNPLMDRLGKASYITYIVQSPLWHYFHAAVNGVRHRPLSDASTGMAEFLLFVVFLLLASLFLDTCVDEPIRRRLNRWGKKPRAERAT
jgi:peptidoglycan/LPS O-acetylase OafA/YrhL